jgi:hypothetical protein
MEMQGCDFKELVGFGGGFTSDHITYLFSCQ